jgi:hypothetical protein
MANRYAVADGLWSNTSTWDGGTLPGTTDDVYANNYDISIDQDITVASISNDGSLAGYTDGGKFKFVDGYSLSGNIFCGGTENCLISDSGVLNSPINIYGNISFSTSPSVNNTRAFYFTSRTGILNIVGDITGGDSSSYYSMGVDLNNNYGDTTVTVSGNLNGSDRGVSLNITNSYCDLNLFGNSTGGSKALSTYSSSCHGLAVSNSSGTYNLTGNITGGGPIVGRAVGVYMGSCQGSLNINGNITGGDMTSSNDSFWAMGLYKTNCSFNTIINGNVTGAGVGYWNKGIYVVNSNGDFTINGNINGDVAPGAYIYLNNGSFTLNGTSQGGQAGVSYGFQAWASDFFYINGACKGGTLGVAGNQSWGGNCQGHNTAHVTSLGEHKPGGGAGYSFASDNSINYNSDGLKIHYCSGVYHSGNLICDTATSNTYFQGAACLQICRSPEYAVADIIAPTISGSKYGRYICGFSSYNNNVSYYDERNISGNIFNGEYLNGARDNYGVTIYNSYQNRSNTNIYGSLVNLGGNYSALLLIMASIAIIIMDMKVKI